MLEKLKKISQIYWPLLGILIPVVYISADIFTASQYPGYSYQNQTVSELSAIGAPTQQLWVALTWPFSPLLILFGLNMFVRITHSKAARSTGLLLMLWGLSGYMWLLFPMNMRGNIGTVSDTGHLMMTVFTVLLITSIVIVGSSMFGKWFKLYSFLTVAGMAISGVLAGMQAPNVALHLPTPNMGLFERTSAFLPMIWIAVTATHLLRTEKRN